MYTRYDSRFEGVSEPESLKLRLLEWQEGLALAVDQFVPAAVDELRDHSFMRSVVVDVRELIAESIEIESQRFNSLRGR